jgi:imidazolonepropionase-like amidohydrolase
MEDKIIYVGKLISMHEDLVRDKMVLRIKGEKISNICRKDQFVSERDIPVIDWSNYTVMPGLIDCHDHLGFDLGDERAQAFEPDFVSILRGVRNAKTLLKAGITTLRSMGEKNFMDIYWKKAIEAGWIRGPRLLNSCQLITRTGGHAWYLGIEADGVDGLRTAIRKQVKAGADFIKIMITGGVGTEGSDPRAPEYSVEEVKAAIEEAHRYHRKIAAHAHGGPVTKSAIEYGVDSIEHGVYLSEDELRLMAEKGTYLVINYGVFVNGSRLAHVPEFMRRLCSEVVNHYAKTLRLAKEYGVKVAFGGDTYHADPKSELEALVQSGFSHEEALKAGTICAAELLGMKEQIGSIEVGKFADLIAIKGNPLENIGDIEKIAAVMKGGQVQSIDG